MTKLFAIIIDTTVMNVAIADEPIDSNWVDITNVDPMPAYGWSYVAGVFTNPHPVIMPTPPAIPPV